MSQPTQVKYYHGGPRGLRKILPQGVTQAVGQKHYGNNVTKADKVYITTDPIAAAMYASMHIKGSVYEVLPEGELVHDPDCFQNGLAYECDRAHVVKEIRLKPSEARGMRNIIMSDVA